MRALTIKQPWAYLIIHGGKDIENRKWNTKLRGRFLVHAAKVDDKEAMKNYLTMYPDKKIEDFVRGAIIGSVELVDVIKPDNDERWIWHQKGNYGFVLKDPRPLVPHFPCNGQLNFWKASMYK